MSAYTSKLLVNAVVAGIIINQKHIPDRNPIDLGPWHLVFTSLNAIVFLAVVQLLIFALISFLSTVRNITQQLLQNAVSIGNQLMVMEKTTSRDLGSDEEP